MSGGLVRDEDGATMTQTEAQDAIRRTIERTGRFILASIFTPEIGQVQDYAGLPMRVVRIVTHADAIEHQNLTKDIWGDWPQVDDTEVYFEVVVAD
jgi:hypothetical protein